MMTSTGLPAIPGNGEEREPKGHEVGSLHGLAGDVWLMCRLSLLRRHKLQSYGGRGFSEWKARLGYSTMVNVSGRETGSDRLPGAKSSH